MKIDGTRLAALLGVRDSEVDMVKRLSGTASLIGFALLFFFSGSNALFLDSVGAEVLPWVYIVNAPLVILGGFGYAAWTRQRSTAQVLNTSTWFLAAIVAALWVWNAASDGQAAPFAAAVCFRFLFIFGLLGLWEIASAAFDVRQSKRLVPLVALGTMVAFMVGGSLVGILTRLLGTTQLLAVSAVFFVLYAIAFQQAVAGTDFADEDETSPATPSQIVSDPYSRNLAAMRSITILLIFIAEFIFYEQVQANFDTEQGVATFLGLFMAGSTLVMVVVTAVVSSRYIIRFGVGVGLATMPGGLLVGAIVLAAWGAMVGEGRTFFILAVAVNLVSIVLGNAIETPVGAVMYQPMPIERRMPTRVAVDGWLGSVALLAVGLLLLAVQAIGPPSVLPIVGLLGATGGAGVLLARRLHLGFRGVLDEATTLAFSGRSSAGNFADSDLLSDLVGADPATALAVARLVQGLDTTPLQLVLPGLVDHPDDGIASLAIQAVADQSTDVALPLLTAVVEDDRRSSQLRAEALLAVHNLRADTAHRLAKQHGPDGALGSGPLAAQSAALRLMNESGTELSQVTQRLATSVNVDEQLQVAAALSAWPSDAALTPAMQRCLQDLLTSADRQVLAASVAASQNHVDTENAPLLVGLGTDPSFRRSALDTLTTGGAAAVSAIEAVLDSLSPSYLVDLVDQVYANNTRRPMHLHQFLSPDCSSRIRRAGFDAVRRADIELPATIDRMTRDDVEWSQLILATYRDTGPHHPTLIDLALASEYESVYQTVWAGLRAKGSADRVAELEAVARRSIQDDHANAIEALDSLLPLRTRDLVIPLLESTNLDEAIETASFLPVPLECNQALERLLAHARLAKPTRELLEHHLSDVKEPHMSQVLERVVALKRIDIFATLPYALLAELAEVVEERKVQAGEVVVEKGELGDELFALTSGEVDVEVAGSRLRAGTTFGELAVLDPGSRSSTITAHTDATMLVVGRNMLLALTDRHPEVMAEIARVLAARLRAANS